MPYRMWSHDSSESSGDGWSPMDEGAAPKVWRRRATAIEAVAKCLSWTGFVLIPAMRVTNDAGEVVWQQGSEYDKIPEKLLPRNDQIIAVQTAKAMLSDQPLPEIPTDQEALF